jgi:hypothetical protein
MGRNKMNLKHISIKIDENIYNQLVNLTIKRSNEENRIVKLSEIIREKINIGIKHEHILD